MENVQIALLGLGTVGTGVYKVLKAQKEEISHKVGTEIQLKKILVRNTKKRQKSWMILLSLPQNGRVFWRIQRFLLLWRSWAALSLPEAIFWMPCMLEKVW